MLWAKFQVTDTKSRITLASTADASIIYSSPNPTMVTASLVTSASIGLCNVSHSGYWGSMNYGKLTWHAPLPSTNLYPYRKDYFTLTSAKVNSIFEPCPNQFQFSKYYAYPNFLFYYRNPILTVEWDMHSVTLALALNMGIVDFDSLTPVISPYGAKVAGVLAGTFYVEASQSPMEPIFCANLTSLRDDLKLNVSATQLLGPPVCVLLQGPFYAPYIFLPMIVSLRSDYAHCSCPLDKNRNSCSNQDYLVSWIHIFVTTDCPECFTSLTID